MRFEGGLGGGVGVAADHPGRVGGDAAGDVHDPPPALLEHRGQQRRAELEHRADVDGERRRPLRQRHGHRRAQRPEHGRVADQDADTAQLGGDPGQRAVRLAGISHVGREHPGYPAAVPHRPCHLIKFLSRARQQRDPGASGRQLEPDGPADAPASAGHQGELAVK